MDTIALMRRILELEDWQLLIDHLADDVVFKVTIGEGTPISPELRGKQAVAGHLLNLGDLLEFRQEVPLSTSRVATASSCWAGRRTRSSGRGKPSAAASTQTSSTSATD